VNTKYVSLKEGSTGMSLVFLVNGEKTVLTSRGANDLLGEEDLNLEVLDKIDALILTSLNSPDNAPPYEKSSPGGKKQRSLHIDQSQH